MTTVEEMDFGGDWLPHEIHKEETDGEGRAVLTVEFYREAGGLMCPGCESDQDYHACQLLPVMVSTTCQVVLVGGEVVSVTPELT